MFKRRKGLTQDEIIKLMEDLENEIFNDSDSDATNSENRNKSADNTVNVSGSKHENDLIWRDAVESDKAPVHKFVGVNKVKGAAENITKEIDYFFSIFT